MRSVGEVYVDRRVDVRHTQVEYVDVNNEETFDAMGVM